MSCPKTVLSVNETAIEVTAVFEGVLGQAAAGMLRELADKVRPKRKKRIVLDISGAERIEVEGLTGLLDLEQAADEGKNAFEVRARGPQAAEHLARAGLARLLKRGS
jgi:anti-anti-sigma regulatory factor